MSKPPITIDSPEALIDAVRAFLIKARLDKAKICVGLSGGLDSVVLFHILSRCQQFLSFQLAAVHINHGLSPHAYTWSEFAQSYAHTLGYQCTVHPVNIAKHSSDGLEASARKARYAIYEKIDCDAIALGHHQDDQAETLLLQLCRGSGVVGLAAMPKNRPLQSDKCLIRPLLEVSRASLFAYAQLFQLNWVEDESNQDTRFRRNLLRQKIIPALKQPYPQIVPTLARTAHYFAETGELLRELATQDCPAIKSCAPLSQATLVDLSDARQRNVLYWYLRENGLFPDEKWVLEIQKTMRTVSKEGLPSFSFQGKELYVAYGELVVVPAFSPPKEPIFVQWQGESEIAVPAWRGTLQFVEVKGQGLLPSALKMTPLALQGRQGGERLRLAFNRPSHTVKHLWQVAKVPFWQRQRIPFIWHSEKLTVVPGAGQACEPEVKDKEIRVRLNWKAWDFDLKPLC